MLSVRSHDRGGQGMVTAAELLAAAAISEDHEPVTERDAILIQDPTPAIGSTSPNRARWMHSCMATNRGRCSTPRPSRAPVDAAPTGKRVLVVGAGRPACTPPTTSPALDTSSQNLPSLA
jgi:hypothetical protein